MGIWFGKGGNGVVRLHSLNLQELFSIFIIAYSQNAKEDVQNEVKYEFWVKFSKSDFARYFGMYLANKCMVKVNDRNTEKRSEICSKLTIKTPERGPSGVFIQPQMYLQVFKMGMLFLPTWLSFIASMLKFESGHLLLRLASLLLALIAKPDWQVLLQKNWSQILKI